MGNTHILAALGLLLAFTSPACDKSKDPTGPDCSVDSDCPAGHRCSASGVCDCSSHANMGCHPQVGPGADPSWFDSCGNPEDTIEDCPDQNAECVLNENDEPVCRCLEHWDPQQNCTECLSGWIEPDCREADPHFSFRVDFDPAGPGAIPMPAVLRPGAYYGKADEPDRAAFAGLAQNSGRIGWGLDWFIGERTILLTPNLQAFITQLNDSDLMRIVALSATDVLASGGLPIIELFGIPEYLSSCPGSADFRSCPPISYGEYADLVEAIAEYFAVGAGLENQVAYEIWNEPDNHHWQGTHLEYFQLYRSAALGIYRAYASNGLPVPSIGGPATSTASGGIVETGPDEFAYWMVEFFEYVSSTPLDDPLFHLPRLPLDFVSYHNYTFDYANQLGQAVPTVRKWLADSGLDGDTPIALTEWGTWFDEFDLSFTNPYFERLDSEVQAAHTIAGVIMMDLKGVDYHNYSNLSDWALSAHGPNGGLLPAFHGSSDVFNHHNMPKPVFNAFRMLSTLADLSKKVPVEGFWDDEWYKFHSFTKAVAGVNDDGTMGAILVANSIPERRKLFRDAIIAWFGELSQGFSEQDIIAAANQLDDPAILQGPPVGLLEMLDGPRCDPYPCLLDDMRDSNGEPLTPLLRLTLGEAAVYILQTDPLRDAPGHTVVLTLVNAPPGLVRVYPLDRNHANPHAAYMGVWASNGFGFVDFGVLDITPGKPHYDLELEAIQAALECQDLVLAWQAPTVPNESISIWVTPDSVKLITFGVDPLIEHTDPADSGCTYR